MEKIIQIVRNLIGLYNGLIFFFILENYIVFFIVFVAYECVYLFHCNKDGPVSWISL